MKFLLPLALGLAITTPALAQDAATEARIRADVTFLADDALEGRQSGQRGYDLAALYVQTRMEAMGLTPGGVDGTWTQPITFARSSIAPEGASLSIATPGGGAATFTHGQDAMIGAGRQAGQATVSGDLVFVGYGQAADYEGLDTAGKIVVILAGAPAGMVGEPAQRFEAAKNANAESHGAVGVITINTEASAARFTPDLLRRFAGRTETAWVGPDGLTRSRTPGLKATAYLTDTAATSLFAAAPRSYMDVRAEAATGSPRGFVIPGTATFTVNTARTEFVSANVIGLIEGTDPVLRNEYVVLTAHLDHIGLTTSGDDKVNNGALDNAGGTAAMLEAARGLAASPPRRSVLVVALAAEEMGLLGSDYLARHPVVETVVANVNLDMPILTYRFTDVVAFGAEHSSLGPLVDAAARTQGVTLSPDPMPEQNVFVRSDHYSFVQAGVPAVMLATGYASGGEAAWGAFFANGYHQPSDEIGAGFDWTAAAHFARINEAIARGIADADQRPLWYEGNPYGESYAPGAPRAVAP